MPSYIPVKAAHYLKKLGETINLARRNKGWRQADLAERVGVARQTIAKIEQGDAKVTMGCYISVTWMLKIPIFFSDEESEFTDNTILNNIISHLQQQAKKRIRTQKDKPIDDNF
jgi:transcriptional regulator with XRE-family HTH domain